MSKKKSKQNSLSNKTNGSTSALNLKGNFSHYPSLTDVHSYKLHPLLAMTCDDEKKYCTGNFSLQFINLSYNWFSKLGLDALFEAVTYQAAVGPQETGPGLMCIHLEGLYMIKDSLEVNKLYNILDNRSIPSYLDCRDLTKFMKRHDDDNNIVLTE
ncbi:uncharacterized protein LOC142331711 [Lycorma delicatula]|uniref:uncharacterized protein LOC142331711 n=1 Tax=Lycorma delicatula TaxID=130591 RepID=UPI003F517857